MVSELLGLSDLASQSLFDLATEILGPSRADRCLDLSRLAPLSRRWAATGAVAELIAGTRLLGEEWWGRTHHEMVVDHRTSPHSVLWEARGSPGARLGLPDGTSAPGKWRNETVLEALGYWIQDDAADFEWGRPVDFVDLNNQEPEDRILLPAGARPGDCFVASFDPGSRVWVRIVEWDDLDPVAEQRGLHRARVGSRLAEHDICNRK
jgi:hypothetical protein